jgi:lysophospholipase L1-like esterase
MTNPRLLWFLLPTLVCGCYASPPDRPPGREPVTSVAPSIPPPVSVRMVLLGDSLARGTGDESGAGFGAILAEEFRKKNIETRRSVNLGLDGARTRHLLDQLQLPRVERLIAEADLVVISVGANDLFVDSRIAQRSGAANPDEITERALQRIDEVIKRVHELNPDARVFLLGLYNPFFDTSFAAPASSFVQRWNASLAARFTGNPGVVVVPTYDLFQTPDRLSFDRFHPSTEGYRRIAERIAGRVAEISDAGR